MSARGWSNPAHVMRLKVLWAQGLSASEIAENINRQFPDAAYTRNGIIGKAHRLSLGGRKPASRPGEASLQQKLNAAGGRRRTVSQAHADTSITLKMRAKAEAAARAKAKAALVVCANNMVIEAAPSGRSPESYNPGAWEPIEGTEPVHLLDRAPFTCRWPIGTDIGWCCGVIAPDDRYCSAHRTIAFAPPKPKAHSLDYRRQRRRAA